MKQAIKWTNKPIKQTNVPIRQKKIPNEDRNYDMIKNSAHAEAPQAHITIQNKRYQIK
jgi:hypothetical protein